MPKIDLDSTNNPYDVGTFLRDLAAQYSQDALELQAAWGDKNAGLVWEKLSKTLEKAAASCDKVVETYFK